MASYYQSVLTHVVAKGSQPLFMRCPESAPRRKVKASSLPRSASFGFARSR